MERKNRSGIRSKRSTSYFWGFFQGTPIQYRILFQELLTLNHFLFGYICMFQLWVENEFNKCKDLCGQCCFVSCQNEYACLRKVRYTCWTVARPVSLNFLLAANRQECCYTLLFHICWSHHVLKPTSRFYQTCNVPRISKMLSYVYEWLRHECDDDWIVDGG